MASQQPIYSIEQSNALIPQVRAIVLQLAVEQRRLDAAHAEMHRQLGSDGDPAAAARASQQQADVTQIHDGMRGLVDHLAEMGIELRDMELGLVDFPGVRDGRPVWLCWRLADPSVAFWHGTDEGYANRRPW